MNSQERVILGVAFLNEAKPTWRNLITEPVSIESPHTCVLSQVFAAEVIMWGYLGETGYHFMARDLGEDWAIAHGFNSYDPYEIRGLNKLWKEVLGQ